MTTNNLSTLNLDEMLDLYDSWAYDNFELTQESSLADLVNLREAIHQKYETSSQDDDTNKLLKALDKQLLSHFAAGDRKKLFKRLHREQIPKSKWWWWVDSISDMHDSGKVADKDR